MSESLRLGKLLGIDVRIHISWFIILILLTWSLATSWFPRAFTGWMPFTYWITAFASTLLLFVCILVHEMAHALVARIHNIVVKGITLFVFGGVTTIDQESKRPGIEFQMAIAGPLASFLLVGVAWLLSLPLRGSDTPAEAVLDYLTITNLLLGAFNLLPGFPLDGGYVLHSIIWKVTGSTQRATRIASAVGQGCGYLFILLGIGAFFAGSVFDGLWIAFIGWFLLNASQAAQKDAITRMTLHGVTVEQVMQKYPITAPANISLQKVVDTYMVPHGLQSIPVTQGDYLCGMITLSDIGHIERERWAAVPVGHTMQFAEQMYVVTPEQPLLEVLQEITIRGLNDVPVTHLGNLIGLVSHKSIMRYLSAQQDLQQERQPTIV